MTHIYSAISTTAWGVVAGLDPRLLFEPGVDVRGVVECKNVDMQSVIRVYVLCNL